MPALTAALHRWRRSGCCPAASIAGRGIRLSSRFSMAFTRRLSRPSATRLRRGRAAVRDVLAALAAAHAAHDDRADRHRRDWRPVFAAGSKSTPSLPDSDGTGVQLVDDQAARYGEFDEIALVGLIEGEWPDRPKTEHFLSGSRCWPRSAGRRKRIAAAPPRSRFLELLQSPRVRAMVSTVSLDDEALVEPSTFVDEIPRARLSRWSSTTCRRSDPIPTPHSLEGVRDGDAREWIAMRAARSSPRRRRHFMDRSNRSSPRAWSVSALETYLGCPFKFFAQHVLQLEEEPDDEEVMDPRRAGTVRARGVRGLLQALAGGGAPGDHARHHRHGAVAVS